MGLYADHILPRGIHWCMGGRPFRELRQRWLADLAGEVVELGFGSGLNLPHDPSAVTAIAAVEPDAVARRLTRPMDRLLEATGYRLHGLERFEMSGPRFASAMYAGQAEPPPR